MVAEAAAVPLIKTVTVPDEPEVNGNRDQKIIAEFVDNHLLAKDSRALREYIADMSPGVELTFSYSRDNGEVVEGLQIPITVDFFWPTS